MLSTVSSFRRERGISLETLQWERASSCVEGRIRGFPRGLAGIWGFLSSCDVDLTDPLVLPQESQVSVRVVRDLSGFLSSQCRGIGPHLELRLEPQGSSPVLTWISGFQWSFNRGSGLVSCGDLELCFPLEISKRCQASCLVDLGIWGFFSRSHGTVTPPFVF